MNTREALESLVRDGIKKEVVEALYLKFRMRWFERYVGLNNRYYEKMHRYARLYSRYFR